ncbi:hypothetical protein ASF54_13235 [Frondihabitans sp. Leaf304]|nr:hypothetical protein ASF54_13235 [Frondihabitans sp. Leaf304]
MAHEETDRSQVRLHRLTEKLRVFLLFILLKEPCPVVTKEEPSSVDVQAKSRTSDSDYLVTSGQVQFSTCEP